MGIWWRAVEEVKKEVGWRRLKSALLRWGLEARKRSVL
jgi:hypothetical protein